MAQTTSFGPSLTHPLLSILSIPMSGSSSSSSSSSTPPEIGVGASDTILLAVSGVGFCFLALTMYFYIIPKLKNANELDKDEEELDENGKPISYDEKLARITDVSTLNRAQRRARARHIMKQQRKDDGNVRDENINDEPPVQDIPPMNENNHNNNNNQHHHNNLRHLSRKERTERAKQKEREERRSQESIRRREQQKVEEILHQQKQRKDRQKAIEAEQQRQQRIQQRETDEWIAYQNWRTFLPIIKGAAEEEDNMDITTTNTADGNVLTVHEWIKELNEQDRSDDGSTKTKIVTISSLSKRCGVPPEQVHSRIHELLVSGRVTGILQQEKDDFTTAASSGDGAAGANNHSSTYGTKSENEEEDERFNDGYFIYVPRNVLSVLASQIGNQEDKITLKDIQRICRDHLFSSSDPNKS